MIRDIPSNEFFTILLILGIAIVALAKVLNPERFEYFSLVLGNSKYTKIYSRDQRFIDKFDTLLFVNLIICLTLFYFLMNQKLSNYKEVNINSVLEILIGIGAFIFIKALVERLIGSLFEIDKLINDYLFQKISYKNYMGLILLPINAILLFCIQDAVILIYIFISILFGVNVIGLLTSFKTHQSVIKTNYFYFILYLCTLEIAPYTILYKVFFL